MFEIALGLVVTAVVFYPLLAAWARIQGDKERCRRRLANPRKEVPLELARRVPPASYGPLRHVRPGQTLLRAKAARLLLDGGQAFPDMLAAIAGASRSVRLETFALAADGTGERFADALAAAAQRGARVRVVYDDIGSRGRVTRDFVEHLAERGVEIAVYHPLRLHRPSWAWNRRDHRKILIVDDEVSFTGGLGITDQYAPTADGGLGWRDTHLRAEGPAVALALAALFDSVWARSQERPGSGLREIPPPRPGSRREIPAPTPPGSGPILMSVLANTEFWRRRAIRQAYRFAIDRAERYVLIENAYFIPDPGFRRALSLAAARGVLVAVVVARSGDVPIADFASRATFSELLAGGVRIFEWPGAMLHAKTAVIDDSWAIVGSYNLDHRSLFHNLEAVVTLPNRSFARDLKDATLDDILKSREITLADHAARPALTRWKESLCFGLRFWL